MDINKLFEYNKNWVNSKLRTDSAYFKKLSKEQKPEILYIGCSDSRVSTKDIMGIQAGEAFVHRNIANMVPNTDVNVMSVINFAVSQLKVNHIVICGHYDCGGVKAAMIPSDLGLLNPWLRNIRDVYRLHKQELDSIENKTDKFNRLVELNVEEQCVNVLKTAVVQKAYKKRQLTVHGWVFNIYNGKLIDLKIDFDKILADIMEIYRLS